VPPALPFAARPAPEAMPIANPAAIVGGQSLSLEAALYGAITQNPDLISLRQGTAASAEAVEVARRLPTTLNPTLWVDVRPLAYERMPGHTLGNGGQIPAKLNQKDTLMYFSLRQPIELGHQTTHRYHIAKAAYNQQQWTVVQAELTALVQTYRFFQTAAYRREKLRIARDLSAFNDRLLQSLQKRLEANLPTVQTADVTLAKVENEATRQLVAVAQQDYSTALADLRNQLGIPRAAGSAEPLGEFVLPAYIPDLEDQAYIQTALQSRPEIHAARAVARGAKAAVDLANGDRIPTPVVGPVYERDEQGTQFFGFVYITPLPVINNGKPLVRQREAEYRRACIAVEQLEIRTVAQVQAAIEKWNGANQLVSSTASLSDTLNVEVGNLEKLFEAGQADVTKLFQARQRLIQLENAKLDATWAATQAQADLLLALGAPSLINATRAPQGGDPTTSPLQPVLAPTTPPSRPRP
jgi:cobalt-zinc-cadmium efflux system outer membrane protein